jgi:ATP-dependent Clp protease ATP-binding subunit ClpX
MDGVELELQPDALEAVAAKAVERQIGARGLRAVMEQIMTKVMYTIPSDLSIRKVIITPECIDGGEPKLIRNTSKPRTKITKQN